ncbi:MAG TPA: cytochrome d ubiquinol oxidase subunit II [Candidatus Acidoferrales bacterium]|nr:cytochrome d ubiquinol oxidase subunit II [Candidatus Acidoferrales bacterium]
MTPLVACVLTVALIALCLYAVFGGADFGGGVWDLLATGRRARAQREAITLAIGPVWEANHVWLIFTIVLLFTCFPPAFADLSIGLFVPLTIALVGIVLRGAAFVFRNYAAGAQGISLVWGAIFGGASVLAPLAFGLCVGGMATGRYAWSSPFAWCIAAFALTLCAQVAAVFLTMEVADAELVGDFRRRALLATLAVAAVGAVALIVAHATEPALFARLAAPRALVIVAVAMLLGAALGAALIGARYAVARILVAGEVVAILGAWFGAQTPYLIADRFTYMQAASGERVLTAFLIATGVGAIVLFPSLWLLFSVFKRAPAPKT